MQNGFEEQTHGHARPLTAEDRKIDALVEKLQYPESKTEYFTDRLVSGLIMALGFLALTKGVPYLMKQFDKSRNRPQ